MKISHTILISFFIAVPSFFLNIYGQDGVPAAMANIVSAGANVVESAGSIPTTATPDVSWWATIIEQMKAKWDQLDYDGAMTESILKSESFREALYTGLTLLEASPEAHHLATIADYYINGYENIVNYYQYLYDCGAIDYPTLSAAGNRLIMDIERGMEDIEFIYKYLFSTNSKLTPAERQALLNEYTAKLQYRWLGIERDLEQTENTAKLQKVIDGVSFAMKDSVGPNDNNKLAAAFSNNTKEQFAQLFEQDFRKAKTWSSGESAISSRKEKYSERHPIFVTIFNIVILALSALYIPYNIWRVNTHERQSNDALIRVIIGLLFGFLMMFFLNNVL